MIFSRKDLPQDATEEKVGELVRKIPKKEKNQKNLIGESQEVRSLGVKLVLCIKAVVIVKLGL